MRFNNEFIAATITEAADIAATKLSQNFALKQIAENGSCTLEEAQNMYELALRVLTEGSEDLIPENLDIPTDATDDQDPTAAQDAAVDGDVDASEGGDLDLSDLEGIILPDSEGNQYIIQGGILTPYTEEDTDGSVISGGDATDGDVDPIGQDPKEEENEDLGESTTVTESETLVGDVAPITEGTDVSSVFSNNSSIVANLIKNVNFAK